MSSKKEVWKRISFQGKKPSVSYAVSSHGRFGVMDDNGKVDVRTFKPQSGGYRYNFKIDGKSKALFVYKEVAKAFVNKPSPKHSLVIRKDHNYLNDKISNLKWVTPAEHKEHVTFSPNSVLARKKKAITKSSTAKVFNEKTVKEVKKLIWDPKRKLTFKQIAEKFGVSEMQIYRIKTGELWFHVKVDNEPESKRYKENLQNISFQEKKAEKENAVKAKAEAARSVKQKKNSDKKDKAEKNKKKSGKSLGKLKNQKDKKKKGKNKKETLMNKVPAYLKQGDLVIIIATARKTTKELIQPAIDIIEGWGLKVALGSNVFKAHHQFAGTDEERIQDLQWALDHKTAKAILLTGGGYGTIRIIDKVNFKNIKKTPKWFIGYSDVTVVHSRLQHLGIASLHATMAFQFLKNKEATLSLKKLLFGEKIKYDVPVSKLNKAGNAEAEIVGGNLSILYAISGSVDEIETKNKILFLEDLDEQLYHIDRMMLQLKRSGKLKNLKGLIVGGVSEMKDNAVPFGKTAEEIILDAVKEYKYPVCFNFPAGHIEDNRAIYLGKKAKLTVTKNKVSVTYL